MPIRPESPKPMLRKSGALRWIPAVRTFATARPLAFLAILATAGMAAAAISVTYSNASLVSTSVTPAPVQFVAGDDAGPSLLGDYVTSYAISTNKTYITTTMKGVPEASLVVDSLFKLQNVNDVAHTVTLSTPQVSNAYVSSYTMEIFDSADVLQDTLTLTDASPSATVVIPAGATHHAKVTLTLASGAGADNVALSNALSLSVS